MRIELKNSAFFIKPILGACMAIAATSSAALSLEIHKPKAVVELFTSQGCSSCPPADAALKEFNSGEEILGLSLHVDYWDRLGWKDTFGSPDNTDRQWRYARSLGERQVYTPQAVINGRSHLVGSRKSQIEEKSKAYAAEGKGLIVPIEVSTGDDSISVSISSSDVANHATLYAFYFDPMANVEIRRGENAGEKIDYSNIVRKVEMVGMVGPDGMSTRFSLSDLRRKGYEGCALILQASTKDGNPGPILGATVLTDL